MNEIAGLGLRERKRLRTSEAIHLAAIELVLDRGLESTTIDLISDRADVSTRTFFNYFSSKEDALLGVDEVAVALQLDEPHPYDGDPLAATFDLIYRMFEAGGGRLGRSERKREVMHKYPQLITRQMLRVSELEDRLTAIVSGWLAGDERFASETEAERQDYARVILGMCLSTIRVSMKKWASESDADPGSGTAPSAYPRKNYERSIQMLSTVLEKLT